MARDYDTLLLHCENCDTARARQNTRCVCGDFRPPAGWSVDPEESGAIVVFLTKRLGKRYAFYEIVDHSGGTVVFRAQTTAGLLVRFALFTGAVERGFSTDFHSTGSHAANIGDPRLINLLDHGSLKEHGYYAVFEAPRGHTLEDELAKGPLPLARATQIMRELSFAVRSLHTHNITLGLLTPKDVILTQDTAGTLRVLIPTVNWLLGPIAGRASTAYAAPEVRRDKPSAASDQYTLGRMMLEAFTGLGRKTAVGEALPKVPKRIEPILRNMLEPNVQDRLPDLSAVILLLEPRAKKPSEAKTLILADDAMPNPSSITPYSREPTAPPVPGRLKGMPFDVTPPQVPVVRWGSEALASQRRVGPFPESKLPIRMGILALGVAALALATAIVTILAPSDADVPTSVVEIARVTAEPTHSPTPEPPTKPEPEVVAPPIPSPAPIVAPSPDPVAVAVATVIPAAPAAEVAPEIAPIIVPEPEPEPEPEVAAFSVHSFVGVWHGQSRSVPMVLDLKLSADGIATGDIRLTQGTKVTADNFKGTWSRDGMGVEIDVTLTGDHPMQYIGVLSGDLATGRVIDKGRTKGDWSARQ